LRELPPEDAVSSVWLQAPGEPPEKLIGNLPPAEAPYWFDKVIRRKAKEQDAKVRYRSGDDALLRRRGDSTEFLVFIEWCSPPSREERGQPKRKADAQ
jgi:hypothetical protein